MLFLLAHLALAADLVTGVGKVIDGDSLRVEGIEIRLHGVDAPEWSQSCERDGKTWPCGARAKQVMGIWLATGPVTCLRIDTDRYGRWVARCTLGRSDLGRALVLGGGAVAYTRYSQDYASAEAVARAHQRGLWAGTFETPEQFRHP